MIFDNCQRRISEITDQELTSLIGYQEENQWIDFKLKDYHRDPNDREKHKREICKDITAMANAEGGYILIGVQETNRLANGFFTVDDSDRIVEHINSVCLQSIDPRIQNLEVKPRSFEWNGTSITIVIVHIPPSDLRPHSFAWKNSTQFVRRYGDHVREYPISELSEAFSVRRYPAIIGQINDKLNAMLRNTRRDRRNSMSPEDDALEQEEVPDLLHLMKLRFENAVSDDPYYRILAVPTTLNHNAVPTQEEEICDILRNPPNVRRAGFGFTGVEQIESFSDGLTGIDIDYNLDVLKNGFLELRLPLLHRHFEWRKAEVGIPVDTNWLYPYAVCEYPVTFMRLVKAIYTAASIDSEIIVEQEYRNVSRFLLVEGNPGNPLFGAFEPWRHVYDRLEPIVSKQTVDPDFVPDMVAYNLVRHVYASFGLGEDLIPLFDANHNFTP